HTSTCCGGGGKTQSPNQNSLPPRGEKQNPTSTRPKPNQPLVEQSRVGGVSFYLAKIPARQTSGFGNQSGFLKADSPHQVLRRVKIDGVEAVQTGSRRKGVQLLGGSANFCSMTRPSVKQRGGRHDAAARQERRLRCCKARRRPASHLT